MAEKYNVLAEVISKKGVCSAGLNVGDKFIIGACTPTALCAYAYQSIWPQATVLMTGGKFSWQKDPDVIIEACPDSINVVVFKLNRIPAG